MPRALYLSIAIGTVLFVLFAYATITGFHHDVASIGRTSVPFRAVADRTLYTPVKALIAMARSAWGSSASGG